MRNQEQKKRIQEIALLILEKNNKLTTEEVITKLNLLGLIYNEKKIEQMQEKLKIEKRKLW